MGWLIALGVLAVLAAIPLGIALRYDERGPWARAILGPVGLTLYPRPKKERKPPKKEAPQKTPDPAPEPRQAPPAQAAPNQQSGGSWTDFLPLVRLGLNFLGDFRRKLRVNRLELKLTLAGDDPCDLAVSYGRANAAMGNLLPLLERCFVIKKRDVEVQCDFTAEQTVIFARMELTVTIGRLLSLAAVYGLRALKEYFTIRKKRKGGALK
ncbi:MAG: DUF2953 domain-containing protein [Eubacteriales bacterium]|nr:DUF2953 domain-containing protein [Eubacteriales bacterium]